MLLALGASVGVSALINVIDRIFLRRPKIVGKIHQVFGGYFDPSECEILLLVSAGNRRSQSTTLSDWKLVVERHGQTATGFPFQPPAGHRIWPRTKAGSPTSFIDGPTVIFSQGIEKYGWIAFTVQGMTSRELFQNTWLKIIALDSFGRRHSLKPYLLKSYQSEPFSASMRSKTFLASKIGSVLERLGVRRLCQQQTDWSRKIQRKLGNCIVNSFGGRKWRD